MFASKAVIIASMIVVVIAMCFITSTSGKRFDTRTTGGSDNTSICLTNCAQCKKMFGKFFDGQSCAESCIKSKGKTIPDCADVDSIAPFLKKQ